VCFFSGTASLLFYFILDVDWKLFMIELRKLDNDNFKSFLHDHYSSCDGFISFTPDNYPEIMNQIKNKGDEFEQAVSAVIRYLTTDETLESIEEWVHDDWRGNGYRGLDYKIVE